MGRPSKQHETLPHATLRSILDQAIESGQTTRKAMGIACEADDEMVRRWLNGQLPKLKCFRRLIGAASLLPRGLKDQLIEWLLRGTGYRAGVCEPSDASTLDPTGDNLIDGRDALMLQITAIAEGTRACETLAQAMSDGKLSETEKAIARSQLHETQIKISRALDALDYDQHRRMRSMGLAG